ncbi:MAG: O-antigen ligase family protein [Planctomycetaceae bacterium]|nr:O-antigen ligase family protein [Planctomycetaceae bacterium]
MVRADRNTVETFLLQVVDGCLAGVIFLVPLAMGGRHAIGQWLLTVLCTTAAAAWALRRTLRGDPVERPGWTFALALAGFALLTLQLAPLPPWLLAILSPRRADLLPLWNSSPDGLGPWPCLSLTPFETRTGLVLFLDYGLLFVVASQRATRLEDVERFLRWIAMAAVGMAVFGLVQLAASNGKFFWFYEHPFSNTVGAANGSFSNRNHFAHFLALGIGPLIWWLQDLSAHATKPTNQFARAEAPTFSWKPFLWTAALGLVLLAGLLSLSRGGVVSLFAAAAVCTAVCYRVSALSGRFLVGLTVAALAVGGVLTVGGFDQVGHRMDDLWGESLDRLDHGDARRTIWANAIKAASDEPLLGTGVGSFSNVYPMYDGSLPDEGVECTHAENGYLQKAAETGLVGLGLTLIGLGTAVAWCLRGMAASQPTRRQLCAAAILAGLTAATVHSFVDFVWYVPACMAFVVLLAACAKALNREAAWKTEPEKRREASPVRSFSLLHAAVALLLAALGLAATAERLGPAVAQVYWDDYLVAFKKANAQPYGDDASAWTDPTVLRRWIACLDAVVRWQPTHAKARLTLAEQHQRLFESLQLHGENPMSLANLRDAAIRSHFPSRQALAAWLDRAVGPHWSHLDLARRHARAALASCPLQGRGYVYLSDLAFLVGGDEDSQRACLQQAIRVRPYDGAVLYAAAAEAMLRGDTAGWLECSKRVFQFSHRQQRQYLLALTAQLPTENLPDIAEFLTHEFHPDRTTLQFLCDLCQKRCPANRLTPLLQYSAEQARQEALSLKGGEAAIAWLDANDFYRRLRDADAALQCARNAAKCDPNCFQAHLRLGLDLLGQQQFAEAEPHLRWCRQRRPNDQSIENKLREAFKGRIENQRNAAANAASLQ